MFSALVLVAILGPIVLLMALWKTSFRWVPGVLLFVAAAIMYSQIDRSGAHGEDAALVGLGNAVVFISAILLAVYGFIMLILGVLVGANAQERRERLAALEPLPAPLPVATAVAGVNKD